MRKSGVEDAYSHMTSPVNVCDVEKIYRWFSEADHYVRINFVVTLLENCCGFEFRFIASCLENMCQKSYKSLIDEEKKANCKEEIERLPDSDVRTRYNLIIFLSLLRSNNEKCAAAIYHKIASSEACRLAGNYDSSIENDSLYNKELGQKLLLYTLGSKHPAFSFHHRRKLCETARNLVRQKEGADKIAVAAAAHCAQPTPTPTYIREQYNQPVTHTYPVRAACAKNSTQSPAKGNFNPTFTLQVTWSDHHISHAKHTSEDFCHLHDKVMQMVEQNSAAQESLQKLRNNGFATSETVDNYLKCLFSSSVTQAIHQSETLFRFFKPRMKSRSTVDGETDTTQSTTSTNRERDQMIKSRTVDSGNRRSNIQDQLLLSKEAPAVLRTSPTKNSHHLKESRQKSPRSRPSSKNRHLQNCNLETPCVLRTEELPDKTLLSVNVSDEQPVSNKHIEPSLEPTNPDSLKRSNSNTKGTHFSSSSEKKPITSFSAVLKQSPPSSSQLQPQRVSNLTPVTIPFVEEQKTSTEMSKELLDSSEMLRHGMAFNIQTGPNQNQYEPNVQQRHEPNQMCRVPVPGEEFSRIASVDTNEVQQMCNTSAAGATLVNVITPQNSSRNNGEGGANNLTQSQPPSVPSAPGPSIPGNTMRLSIATGPNVEGPKDFIMLSPQIAGGITNGIIHLPVQQYFYQTPPPGSNFPNNPHPCQQMNSSVPLSSTVTTPVSSNVENVAPVNNLSDSRPIVVPPTTTVIRQPLASDIVKGVASTKTSPTNASPPSAWGNPTINCANQTPNPNANIAQKKLPNEDLNGSKPNAVQQSQQVPNAWIVDQHSSNEQNVMLVNRQNNPPIMLNKMASIDSQHGIVVSQHNVNAWMPFKYGAVASTGGILNMTHPQMLQFLHAHGQHQMQAFQTRNPGQIIMAPTYHKQLNHANFIPPVPTKEVNMGVVQSNVLASPNGAKEAFCSNCGKSGHLFYDCDEPSMGNILHAEEFRIKTDHDGKPQSSQANNLDDESENRDVNKNQLNVSECNQNLVEKEPRSSSSTCSNNEFPAMNYQSKNQHQNQSNTQSHISKQVQNQLSRNTSGRAQDQTNRQNHQAPPRQILQRGSKDASPKKGGGGGGNYSRSNENAGRGQGRNYQAYNQNQNLVGSGNGGYNNTNKGNNFSNTSKGPAPTPGSHKAAAIPNVVPATSEAR